MALVVALPLAVAPPLPLALVLACLGHESEL